MYDLSWCFPGYYNGLIWHHNIRPKDFTIHINMQINKTNEIVHSIEDTKIDTYA